jgi:glycosyltransferase involved in cell wall biosynthesis
MHLLTERPGTEAQKATRLLLVSYVFPPDPTVGARRWSKLANFLADRGWGLDVITRAPDRLTPAGTLSLEALPSGVRVYGVPAVPLPLARVENVALRLYRGLRRRRSTAQTALNPALTVDRPRRPETVARVDVRWSFRSPRSYLRAFWVWREVAQLERWSRKAATAGQRIAQSGVHQAVITSGPPHWTHLAGRSLARHLGVPFVMDMRDPWSLFESLMEQLASPLTYHYTQSRERQSIEAASLVIANTEQARHALSAKYPRQSSRIITVTNGIDDDVIPPPRRTEKFIISYAGTVYVLADLRNLMRAARRVVEDLQLTPDEFGIELIGHFDVPNGAPASLIASEERLSKYVTVVGVLPHADVMDRLAYASLLVTLPGFNAFTTIPAKVFECMRFNAWLLALSEPGSATDTLLRGTDADVVSSTDLDGIAAAVRDHVVAYLRQGIRPNPIAADSRFTRAAQSQILLDAVERVIDANASRTQ